jgi:predicted DNA-binding ribbon-helix-helix protein
MCLEYQFFHSLKKLSEEEKLENKMLHIAQASALRR